MRQSKCAPGVGSAPQGCSEPSVDTPVLQGAAVRRTPKPPGRSLMNVCGNAASRGMTALRQNSAYRSFCRMITHTTTAPAGIAPRRGWPFGWVLSEIVYVPSCFMY